MNRGHFMKYSIRDLLILQMMKNILINFEIGKKKMNLDRLQSFPMENSHREMIDYCRKAMRAG